MDIYPVKYKMNKRAVTVHIQAPDMETALSKAKRG